MTGVLHKTIKDDEERSRSETAAKLEFLNLTQAALNSGEILNMAQLEQAFDYFSNKTQPTFSYRAYPERDKGS